MRCIFPGCINDLSHCRLAKFTKIVSDNSFSSITDLLFVYGTIKRGGHNAFAAHLQQHGTYVGNGWFSGRLYQIDGYPGAIYDSSVPTSVWGEVYQIHQPAVTLSLLDNYEGVDDNPPMYTRRIVPVNLGDQKIACQAYLYTLPMINLVRIDSGQFQLPD